MILSNDSRGLRLATSAARPMSPIRSLFTTTDAPCSTLSFLSTVSANSRFSISVRTVYPPPLLNHQELIGVGIVGQKLAAGLGDEQHVLVLHAEAIAGLIAQRLEAEHHARLDLRVLGLAEHRRFAEIGVLVQEQPDSMADERDRWQLHLGQFPNEGIVDRAAAGARLDHVHDQIFAFDEMLPDALCVRRRLLHDRGTA